MDMGVAIFLPFHEYGELPFFNRFALQTSAAWWIRAFPFSFATQVLWVGGGAGGAAKFGYTMHAHGCCLAVGHPGGICHVTWSCVACVGVLTLTCCVLVIILHA
jgi:hypothetical protein